MNRVVLMALVCWGLLAGEGQTYVQITTEDGIAVRQEDGRAVVNPQVGCPTGRCFNQAVREAAAEWNRTGARFVYRFTNDPTAQVECEARDMDEIITVRWAAVHCGEEWGEETLAMAPLWYTADGLMAADIVFNPTYAWDVYDGPLVSGRQDFRRVVLHELGHTLGLDHPDDYGQTVRAIMNARASDLDRLQADDTAGIRAIYGRTQQTQTKGALENPGANATKTGIGIISGWVCDASRVEIEVKGARFAAAYGTDRGDTRSACGDADNGFVVLVNWNIFGVGTHRIRLLADGRELVSRSVTVKTFGSETLTGQRGQWTLDDWPTGGHGHDCRLDRSAPEYRDCGYPQSLDTPTCFRADGAPGNLAVYLQPGDPHLDAHGYADQQRRRPLCDGNGRGAVSNGGDINNSFRRGICRSLEDFLSL